MHRSRFAVVVCALLLVVSGRTTAEEVTAEESRPHRELARRFVGCSLHWEFDGKPATLVFISEDSVWWMSDAVRNGFSHGDAWYPVNETEVVCYMEGIIPFSIRFEGDRFTMGVGSRRMEGDVVWPQP